MIRAATRRLVRKRANDRCEYCRMPEFLSLTAFQVEHIIAQQHVVDDSDSNLALACDRCNLFKGPNLASIDPESGAIVQLFHPRNEPWSDHFEFQGTEIVGLTQCGRATVKLLNMNTRDKRRWRKVLLEQGEKL
jgi:hypothetical protein